MIATIAILVLLLAILLVVTLKSFGINREYERAVLFRLGRLGQTKGPGWFWLIPFVDRIRRVDMRTITYQLETQETITRDGVAVRVNAVFWFRAESPVQVINSVENWMSATVQAAETSLRDAIGQSDLDAMALAKRYSADPNAKRADLDGAFADAMLTTARYYPQHDDISLLAAEAAMDTLP